VRRKKEEVVRKSTGKASREDAAGPEGASENKKTEI